MKASTRRKCALWITLITVVGLATLGSLLRFGGRHYEYDATARWVNILAVPDRPERVLYRLLDRYHAFPQQNAALTLDDFEPAFYDRPSLSAVSSFRVSKVKLSSSKPLLESLRDDDPTYGATIELCVTYRDGSQRLFEVTLWRYGLFLGLVSDAIFARWGEGWVPGKLVLTDERGCP